MFDVGCRGNEKGFTSWFRWLIDNSNIGYTYKYHERQEKTFNEFQLYSQP